MFTPKLQEKFAADCTAIIMAKLQEYLTTENSQPSEFVNVPQSQELLGGICRQSLSNYEKSGKLKSYRVAGGRLKMYKRADVLALLQTSQEVGK
jgi:hypothetical protein